MSENIPEEINERRPRRRRGLFFPLLLLSAGVLLLMSNFGYLPGGFWGFVQTYWPALLILAGLDGLIKGEGITASVLIAGVGGLLLAGNLGYASISAWDMLSKGWPLILIGIGVDIILGRHSIARAIIGIFMALVLIGGMFWLADLSFPGSVNAQDFSQPYKNETSLQLYIERAAGRLELGSTKSSSDPLLDGEFNLLKSEKLEPSVEMKNGGAVITLDTGGNDFPAIARPSQNAAWKIKVNPAPELTLRSKLAMGETRLDLRGLTVKDVFCETTTGRSEIYIADTKEATYHISGATGEIVIRVPKEAAVTISVDNAIGTVSFPDDYTRVNGEYNSPSFSEKDPAIKISVDLPIGALRVVEYSSSM
jgi:hypothetical protein